MNGNPSVINKNLVEYVAAARAGDYERAKKILRLSIAIDPQEEKYYINLAGVYSEEGEYRKAISALNLVKKLSIDVKSLYLVLAYCYDGLGNTSAAREIAEQELLKNKDSFFFKNLLISICIKDENYLYSEIVAKDLLEHPEIDGKKFIEISNILISLIDIRTAFVDFDNLSIKSIDKNVVGILEAYRETLRNVLPSQEFVKVCNIDEMERENLWRQLPLSQHRKLLHIHDAHVGISSQTIMVGDRICRDLCYHLEPNASSDIMTFSNTKFGARKNLKSIKVDEAIFIGGGKNYYHWMVDYLPGLGILEEKNLFRDLPVIFNGELTLFQKQSLEHIGFDFSRHLDPGEERVIHCSQLWATTRSSKRKTIMGMPDWWQSEVEIETITWLRNAFLNTPSRDGAGRKLYLSRGDARFRRLLNDEEVVELMLDAGYDVIYPDQLSIGEQVSLFSEASHVVGVHGAAFTNIVFMSPGTKVMEIVGKYKPPQFYKKISSILNISHDMIEADIQRIEKKSLLRDPRFGDISVDILDLRRKLTNFDGYFCR